ncbi:hypothetical protein HY250_02860 [Candidatus Azambacteria bacterium]|nr:hypothetical protein [Candidatus Azambacteria bacterium]MBI3685319.1 hypothetical protein [Candidatus Azambacteria bacterium]
MGKIFAILVLATMMMSGCATIQIPSDSPYRKVFAENTTTYELEVTGAIEEIFAPGEIKYPRMECTGYFEGIAYAYLIHGFAENGAVVKEYIGEAHYSFIVDNRPEIYKQVPVDAHVSFANGFSIQSKVLGGRKKSRFLPGLYQPCSFLIPTVKFEWKK